MQFEPIKMSHIASADKSKHKEQRLMLMELLTFKGVHTWVHSYYNQLTLQAFVLTEYW